jgi:methylenetetrahydrofolate reductase (NADPH)
MKLVLFSHAEVSVSAVQVEPVAKLSGSGRLLEAPRYEVIPVKAIEDKVAVLPRGAIVTVTASPRHGMDRTVDVSSRLAGRGYRVVPHLAARMIADRGQLERILAHLDAAGIHEAFVVGGDASPPAGIYADAGDLLEDIAALAHPLARIGVGAYPEGHPLISADGLLEALRRKQRYADYMVTQICFEADALERWIRAMRAAGIGLPVVVGLPGVVDRRRLAEISLRTGVGASLRYLARHGRQVATLARSRRYDPTWLAREIAVRAEAPDLGISGAHLFTFNEVEATASWVGRASLAGTPALSVSA